MCSHVKITPNIEVVTHTDWPDDNCYGYNFNGLYLLWFTAFLMKRTRVEQHLENGRNVPHFATGWSRDVF
jgi:hypothetical protein